MGFALLGVAVAIVVWGDCDWGGCDTGKLIENCPVGSLVRRVEGVKNIQIDSYIIDYEKEFAMSFPIPDTMIETIKHWIKCDNEIRILQKELNLRKNEKKQNTAAIIEIMKMHGIDCFAIKDGNLQYKRQNIKKPLSQTYLLQLLLKYHQGDEERALELQNFLKANREDIVRENIVFRK